MTASSSYFSVVARHRTVTRSPLWARLAFYADVTEPDLLECGDDGAGVRDHTARCLAEARKWAALARSIRAEARRRGRPYGRGYRLAVSRAGVWTRRARAV